MMHKIKKATTNAKGTENSEYVDYKNRLDMLSAYLKESSGALKESEKAWLEVCTKQKAFADKFANRYPDKDRIRDFAKQSAGSSQDLVKEFVLKTEGHNAPHWQIDGIVHDYIKEINDVATEYKSVDDAAKEVSLYTKKVDDLGAGKRKADEAKLSRNMEKLEDARNRYELVLDRVVDRMKVVYNKRQVALKATYIAYWSQQLRAFNMIDGSLDPTREFVETGVTNLSKIKIRTMTEEDVEQFRERNSSVPDTKPRSPANSADRSGATKDTMPTSPIDTTADAPADPPAAEI